MLTSRGNMVELELFRRHLNGDVDHNPPPTVVVDQQGGAANRQNHGIGLQGELGDQVEGLFLVGGSCWWTPTGRCAGVTSC